jgi:RHS repeat-associated protein
VTTRGYTDQEHVQDLGLINMNARMYDPLIGKFIATDPIIQDATDLQDLSAYAYVKNNPLAHTDPTGMDDTSVDDEGGVADVWLLIGGGLGRFLGSIGGWLTSGSGGFASGADGPTIGGYDPCNGLCDKLGGLAPGDTILPSNTGNGIATSNSGPNSSIATGDRTITPAQVDAATGNSDPTIDSAVAALSDGYTVHFGSTALSPDGQQYTDATDGGVLAEETEWGGDSLDAALARGSIYALGPDGEPEMRAGGGAADTAGAAATEGTVTVGRFMSPNELSAMQETGLVQESFNNGVTSVTLPPNPGGYLAAPSGDVFVQFDVPESAIGAGPGSTGVAKIYGPNSIFGPRLGITQMPPAFNITVPGQ